MSKINYPKTKNYYKEVLNLDDAHLLMKSLVWSQDSRLALLNDGKGKYGTRPIYDPSKTKIFSSSTSVGLSKRDLPLVLNQIEFLRNLDFRSNFKDINIAKQQAIIKLGSCEE